MFTDTPSPKILDKAANLATEFGYTESHLRPIWVNDEPKDTVAGWMGFALKDDQNSDRGVKLIWLAADEPGTKYWYLSINESIDESHNAPNATRGPGTHTYKFKSYDDLRRLFIERVGFLSERQQ